MVRVGIIGAGHTRFGVLKNDVEELLKDAVDEALSNVDRGIDAREIDAVIVGNFLAEITGVGHLGPLALSALGNLEADAYRVESACASGGLALYQAWQYVRFGVYDNVLVVGVEKMTDSETSRVTEALARASTLKEMAHGFTFPGIFALMAREHMRLYGSGEEHLALVAVKNHENALKNPKAHFRRRISVEDVLNSPIVASPLKLYDCSPISDGAAAVIVSGKPREYTDTPIYIDCMATGYDKPALYDRRDIARLLSVKRAADKVYSLTGLTPKKLDVIELHDCFTIAEIIIYEELGLARRGEGHKLVEEGVTRLDGELPVNPSGGLKAKGHPVGATGVSQAVEMYLQLRGEAGERQVEDAEIGLTANMGGSGASAVVAVYKR